MARRAEPMVTRAWALPLLVIVLALSAGRTAHAQEAMDSSDLGRAYELENAGRFREAAEQFRTALRGKPGGSALLGLERTYFELRESGSLLPILDTLIARDPREPLYRSVQMRTLQILHDERGLRAAFEQWIRAMPRDPAPYRDYARVLIAAGRPVLADSIVQRGQTALGSGRALAFETAQLRAAQGLWQESAQAWREALVDAPYLSDAAGYALAPTPAATRPLVRSVLDATRELGPRRALAALELGWGRPQEAWDALRAVTPDTAAATAWAEFGERALADDRPALAREALVAALHVRSSPELALRAATAALQSGAPDEVLAVLPIADFESDSSRLASDYLPLQVAALSALGRPADAEALVRKHDAVLAPGQHERLARELANAWVRTGDLSRARAALGSGPDADSSEAAGWLALYEGHLAKARVLLKNARDPSVGFAFALGVVARTHGDDGMALGAALLALARADTTSAIAHFVEAADRHPEAGPALLLAGARLRMAKRDEAGAIELWHRIVTTAADAPEAAEAELEWARALRRRGDSAGAVAHLEHLILSAPQSALLPQARRELDLARAAIPSS